jgi:hypothetical protein
MAEGAWRKIFRVTISGINLIFRPVINYTDQMCLDNMFIYSNIPLIVPRINVCKKVCICKICLLMVLYSTEDLVFANFFGRAVSKQFINRRMHIPLIYSEVLTPLAKTLPEVLADV